MIQYFLLCVMWGQPNIERVEVPVDEYGMAFINQTVNDYAFEASVIEERMNHIQITYIPTGAKAMTHATSDVLQKSLTLRLDSGVSQSSIDCEIRK